MGVVGKVSPRRDVDVDFSAVDPQLTLFRLPMQTRDQGHPTDVQGTLRRLFFTDRRFAPSLTTGSALPFVRPDRDRRHLLPSRVYAYRLYFERRLVHPDLTRAIEGDQVSQPGASIGRCEKGTTGAQRAWDGRAVPPRRARVVDGGYRRVEGDVYDVVPDGR